MGNSEAVPFGVTVSADSLERAREFYTKMYPDYVSITEGRAYARASGPSKCCVQNRNIGVGSSSV
jgi:hypothetical protein